MLHVRRRPGERVVQAVPHIDAGLDASHQGPLVDGAVMAQESREVDAHTDPCGFGRRLQPGRQHDRAAALGGQQRTLRHYAVREGRVHPGLRPQLPQGAPQPVTMVRPPDEHIISRGGLVGDRHSGTGKPQPPSGTGCP